MSERREGERQCGGGGTSNLQGASGTATGVEAVEAFFFCLALAGPVARRLCDSAARPALRLSGPVADAPDVDLRIPARSRHRAKRGLASGREEEAAVCFVQCRSHAK